MYLPLDAAVRPLASLNLVPSKPRMLGRVALASGQFYFLLGADLRF